MIACGAVPVPCVAGGVLGTVAVTSAEDPWLGVGFSSVTVPTTGVSLSKGLVSSCWEVEVVGACICQAKSPPAKIIIPTRNKYFMMVVLLITILC